MTFVLELHTLGEPASVKVLNNVYKTKLGSATKMVKTIMLRARARSHPPSRARTLLFGWR